LENRAVNTKGARVLEKNNEDPILHLPRVGNVCEKSQEDQA